MGRRKKMSDEIDTAIRDLMIKYGPDGHVDGHQLITRFIVELLKGKSVGEAREVIDEIME
jgi:hypothetical protein